MASRFEANIGLQPGLVTRILDSALPSWMGPLKSQRFFFVGTGSNHHAAQIAAALWRRHVSPEAWAVSSFDFARLPQPVSRGDVVVLLSHRGTKSFTLQAAEAARGAGAVTVGITGQGSPWREGLDHRIESCEQEDTGVFTKSLTTTLAWLALWIGEAKLIAGMRRACERLGEGPAFPGVAAETDLVFLGDLEREWVAREAALKVQEAAYLRARAFGLEEFLHGPRISVGSKCLLVAFTDPSEPRWDTVRKFLSAVEAPLCEVEGSSAAPGAPWLWQLFWAQRFTAAACRGLELDPDAMRTQDARYKKARESLSL